MTRSIRTNSTLVADVDTGIDDALALFWLASLHRAGTVNLHVTTSAGNTTAALAARNSTEVLRIAGTPDVPVTAGADRPRVLPLTTTPETHGPQGLGYWVTPDDREAPDAPGATAPGPSSSADDAVDAWVAAAPQEILVAGPATNLARAVERAPEVLRDTKVTLMGGAFLYPGNTTPTAEWNVWSDPHALAFCLENWPSDAPLPVICPLNVTEQVILTPERLRQWTDQAPGETAEFLDAALRFYMEFHDSVGVGYQAQIHDLAAAMVLRTAADADLRDATVRVEADSEWGRGTTVADWTGGTAQGEGRGRRDGDVGPYWHRPPNARVVASLDPEQILEAFASALI